ncbi:MAG: UTP--glucose-1-phosphate uridylyltransferase [Gammaproteobacteria bacterium]|nr:UTP--glucose-1-phosphate uridylyltransferase [Gammaproteobacteria bacterium]
MQARGLPEMAIASFRRHYLGLAAGDTGFISEHEIQPVGSLPHAEALGPDLAEVGRRALKATVFLKLNGGLGTSMGLDQAKSLIEVKPGWSFLRALARQAAHAGAPLVLMNSDRTHRDSQRALADIRRQEPELTVHQFLQHMAPKVCRHDLSPARWARDPVHEWYPPGHGDLYAALHCSGMLRALLDTGMRYLFVSNSDNLGAALDARILGYLVANELGFLMEVTDRTPADRKGGHIALTRAGTLVLREAAQCPAEERESFEDIARHRYFNTNNLWMDLRELERLLAAGAPALPLIRNAKTVDPADPDSTPVYQLESAMGAAVSLIPRAAALRVPRHRFAPVKTTSDLLVVRSDAFDVSTEGRMLPGFDEAPPVIELDARYYARLQDFELRFPVGPPSLRECRRLIVSGDVRFEAGVVLRGDVRIVSRSGRPAVLAGGRIYEGEITL